ncbi:hypothetical protein P171DRAFT_35491 [Karstenula rhodostoma CBS 690.94]|uniref:Uncharacterized protein n=1 Tax=Karstenula rhodostoma CBS 690.94 TaxID=1392251 RepID=A0A9P4PI50_9PLEO|nr:hypothetical protein P171DRAFT_35491 [Karstenula rhodostoma CBS 690.94]
MANNDNPPPYNQGGFFNVPPWTWRGRFLGHDIPITKHSFYDACTLRGHEWDATVRGADEPAPGHGEVDVASLSPSAFAALEEDDDPPDTHLKHVAQQFFKSHIWTVDLARDPGTKVTMWAVLVNEDFKPDPQLSGAGLVSGFELRYSNKKVYRNNQYKLYVLLLLSEELGLGQVFPIVEDAVEMNKSDTVGWDETLQVNLTFKKMYNALIDYYHSERGQGIQTKFVCPLLWPNRGEDDERGEEDENMTTGSIQKEGLREVDITPWLQEGQKFRL